MRKRVLVFEPTSVIRSVLKQLLEKLGYEVLSFPELGFCPFYTEKFCPCSEQQVCADIIISDIDMPNVSGFDFVASQIGKDCKVKNIGLMSGVWSMHDLDQASKLGCKAFYKPFDSGELKKWLAKCEKKIDPNRTLYR